MPRPERPLEAGDSPLLQFAHDLRRLRAKAGMPPYRALAAKAHYAPATLSEAAAGRRLPSLDVALSYVRVCGGDTAVWERRWHELAAELAIENPSRRDDIEAPYRGLAAFQREDADRFYGRDRLVEDLLARLSERSFVGVFGASGAGKSSLLRAGLLARLESAALFTPGFRPVDECERRLAELTAAGAASPGETPVLVVDQFEEIFTLCRDQAVRDKFISLLIGISRAEHPACRVVIGVRADFFPHCTAYPELVDELSRGQLTIGPMNAVELQRALTQPAAAMGYGVEGALQAEIIAEAAGQPGVLPLLSHALLETWHRRQGTMLTLAAFQAAGGLTGALVQTAESAYGALTAAQQELAKNLFVRLTALGEGTEDTKRRVGWAEFDEDADMAPVLQRMTAARLLTADHDGVEISHEALIRCWPRLRDWLAEDRDGRRVHRHLTEATDAWEAFGKNTGALYRGTQLSLALDWAARYESAVTPREKLFLDASQSAEIRGSRRLRRLVALLSVLSVVAVVAMAFAVGARETVAGERNAALAQLVANQATALYPTNPDLAVQLSLTAYRQAPTDQTRDSLLSTLPKAVLSQPNEIVSVAFSPDGHILATGSSDRMARLWDVTDARHPVELATVAGHTDGVFVVAFSPDGRTLVTGGADRTVRLWDLTDARHPATLSTITGHTDLVDGVAFSPDGRTLVTIGNDRTLRLWDLTDLRHPAERGLISGPTERIDAVAFSPDGRTLATGGFDRTVRIWDVADPRHPAELVVLTAHTDGMSALAFSPDGRTLATGGDDRTVRLWDMADPRRPAELAVLTGHVDGVYAVAFSPDGRTLATGADDRTVRLWDISDPRRPTGMAIVASHTDAVASLAFSPDGHTLATGSWDNTTRLLDTDFAQVVAHACDRVRTPITRAEWDRYFPDLPYAPPCTA